MRALVSVRTGGPETLELATLPDPVAGPGDIRIAVAACGVNYPDALIIEDRYQFRPERPFSPGAEVSGVVDQLGEGVSGFRIGDRVLGGNVCGGLAEKMVLPAVRCYGMPASMPFDEASAFLMTYGTSHHALKDRARLQPGETLLVLGAAGGVGLAAVELGKHMGARVIAGVSSEEKLAVARARGADAGFVYAPGPLDKAQGRALTEEIRALADGEVDVIYDPVGGSYSEPALRSLAWDGRFLVVGFPAGIPSIPLNLPLLKGCHVIGVFWGSFIERFPERNRANVEELLEWYEQGAIRPLVSARFDLAQGGQAIAQLVGRAVVGKLVVEVGGAPID
ncbi:NADPH:quinone oxidoreductase family protein [Sphingomonas sp. CGMCC 1.13654]|uniref:NADPH:quinone oxidoreductase family protein n=1 Tax=Sphingomonas chungangi TaxID=2683589 RepID=A0A838L6N4_9SPHN|nr:NADPH:quinone oxidoreductase family protein [Sphingomonas chungangi]MBA2933816.1 NADPH:quinone oxidoreductase family protein [Sphingomonas chungangi]MVW55146.1 zinc-binding dehydrogenase [Sphingomonas chungangi]